MKLNIKFGIFNSRFGYCLIASTRKGVCNVLFADTVIEVMKEFVSLWPEADLEEKTDKQQLRAYRYIETGRMDEVIVLHLFGTEYENKVWKELLNIKRGDTSTYKEIAEKIGEKKHSRSVGRAIGNNPVGYIIPCHRVISSSGALGGYRWGVQRKKAMLEFEKAI